MTAPDQDTMGASVIFNEQNTKGLPIVKNSCPADAKLIGHEGACNKCQRCFSEAIFNQQRSK